MICFSLYTTNYFSTTDFMITSSTYRFVIETFSILITRGNVTPKSFQYQLPNSHSIMQDLSLDHIQLYLFKPHPGPSPKASLQNPSLAYYNFGSFGNSREFKCNHSCTVRCLDTKVKNALLVLRTVDRELMDAQIGISPVN